MTLRNLVMIGSLIVVGCASMSGYESDEKKLALYRQYAGPPVESIGIVSNSGGLSAIGPRDVVFWAGIDQPYLISVKAPCDNLLFANAIGVTYNHSPDTLYARFDSLSVKGLRCPITEIRSVDYAKLRQDKRAADMTTARRD